MYPQSYPLLIMRRMDTIRLSGYHYESKPMEMIFQTCKLIQIKSALDARTKAHLMGKIMGIFIPRNWSLLIKANAMGKIIPIKIPQILDPNIRHRQFEYLIAFSQRTMTCVFFYSQASVGNIYTILIHSRLTKCVIVQVDFTPYILILNGSCGVSHNTY